MREMNQNHIGTRIRNLRLERGMTQENVANGIGISRTCMANYETGKRHPDLLIVRRLSQLLGVSVEFLLGTSKVRNYTLCEEETKNFERALQSKQAYGDVLYLSDMDSVTRVEILDYYEYLKMRPRNKYPTQVKKAQTEDGK
ncbi:MAG: helix-turn-helix transcriptional regulator [Clostridia bacterium]|nr:helix-turn-helix transcriptional regulator [Clostridia bacterium]